MINFLGVASFICSVMMALTALAEVIKVAIFLGFTGLIESLVAKMTLGADMTKKRN